MKSRSVLAALFLVFLVVATRPASGQALPILITVDENGNTGVPARQVGHNIVFDLNASYTLATGFGKTKFTAGINNEADGLFGSIQASPEPGTLALLLLAVCVIGVYRRSSAAGKA